MKKILNIIHRKGAVVVLFLILLLAGCGKNSRMRWVYYDETRCADKWEYTNNNEQLKNRVIEYMDGQGVQIYEIEIFTLSAPESCTDCACRTGRQFKAKVKRSDVSSAKNSGFHD